MSVRVHSIRFPLESWKFFAFFLFVTLFVSGIEGQARAQDVFAISGIEVDESADSDALAKTNGVAIAKRVAFNRLMGRLLVSEDVPRVPAISADRLEFLMRDVAIETEKFGGGRYIATINVRFQPDGIREFLRRAQLAYAETASQPMVVLPIVRSQAGDSLFEDTNPWLDAWARLPDQDGLVRFVPPLGDLADMTSVDAARALGGDIPSLSAIARRYGVGAVLVAVLAQSQGADGIARAEVTVTAYGPGWDGRSFAGVYLDNQDASPPADPQTEAAEDTAADTTGDAGAITDEVGFLERTAQNVADALDTAWKRENLLRFDLGSKTLEVLAPISALSDWLTVRGGLLSAAPISEVRLVSLSLEEAKAEVTFVGEAQRLVVALAQKGLSLEASEDGSFWTVTRAR